MSSDTSDTAPTATGQDPCCGTVEQAAAADACCAPDAKAEAVADGAGCCGPAAQAAPVQADPAAGCCGPAATVSAVDLALIPAAPPAGVTARKPGDLPVVVIGAGPVGLAAAAHLHEQGLPFLVLEAGDQVGASIQQWGHVGVFSPWRYDIDPAARRLLDAAGWAAPDDDGLPTGAELVETYLQPLAKLPAIAPHLHLGARVTAISRLGVDRVRTAGRADLPFVVRLADGTEITASAIIDASGTWRTPNPLGVNGLPAHGEPDAADLIEHALPDVLGTDRRQHAGKHTIVVGSGHSAADTLLDLARLAETEPGTRITWAVRGGSAQRAFGGEGADELPARGALGSGLHALVDTGRLTLVTGFGVQTVRRDAAGITLVAADGRTLSADRVVSATGFRPDHSFASELRLDLDPILGCTRTLADLIDPNRHSCGTVAPHGYRELGQPEPDYYAVGMKSYGRAPTFLMATGYEQVRSIAAALAGDFAAADDVQLDLPETGVCSSSRVAGNAARFGS
ncbi:flavoprotein [Actinoplanes sp. SE50]|uniref:FAD-dependent oxidoreductase n=1 Tax=unclassified Actinoplanes TaxID=2626549 RepID=UPI00023ED0B1|nr:MULTISPECIES: FAD-dependent oxidoreductase [unclassified Actinoplanes]AEV85534.1 Soluble pyridine nucleotide transhydrogenase [Actinoplanes sp. SE50/110]ATO83927.1 flavoprotein [Actinoplanes sp. SE50]SLM01337.1 glutamate synthase subunit beta [Actinoplanes sp. SE50/110]